MPDPKDHSTGRGGAGNIGHDDTVYVDWDIVREGVVGEPTHTGGGQYSAGRGGAGNMVPTTQLANEGKIGEESHDAIPEPAMRSGEGYENYHTGRGGEGNVHRDKYGGHSKPQKEHKEGGFVDTVKHAFGGGHHKKEGE